MIWPKLGLCQFLRRFRDAEVGEDVAGILVERSRGLPRQAHEATAEARRVPFPGLASVRHQAVSGRGEHQTQPLPLDQGPG